MIKYGLQTNIHKLLFWLMWDIGENVGSILQLRKDDFTEQKDSNGDKEYLVRLRREILKRSRTTRRIPTHYPETNQLLDLILPRLEKKEKIFNFGVRNVEDIMKKVSTNLNIKCVSDDGEDYTPTPKDLRSGMSCHLCKMGWSTDEIKGRLGHKPSSRVIDKYVSYLSLDSRKPKIKLQENRIQDFEEEIRVLKLDEKVKDRRMIKLQEEFEEIKIILNSLVFNT